MPDDYTSRDESGGPQLLEIISLYGQRQAVQIALRKQVNNLDRTVEERKQLFADLKAKEAALTSAIEAQLPTLSPALVQQLKEKYEAEPLCAT